MSDNQSKRRKVDNEIRVRKNFFFSRPLTCVRIIRIIKYYYNEKVYVPFATDPITIKVREEIGKQFRRKQVDDSDTTDTLPLDTSTNIHALFNRSLVQLIKPWLYSRSWIIMYFIYKKQKEDIIKDLYNDLITKDYDKLQFKYKTLRTIIHKYIFDLPSPDPIKNLFYLSRTETNTILSQLNGFRCQSEIKTLLKNPFKFELYSVTSDDEKNIKLAFAILTKRPMPKSLPYTLMAYPPFIKYNETENVNEQFHNNELNLPINLPKNNDDLKRVPYLGYVMARDNPKLSSLYQDDLAIYGLENHSILILLPNLACKNRDLRCLICNKYFERDIEKQMNSIPGTND